MKTVAIIGSGQMGSALAFPLRDNHHEVRLVGTHLDHTIIEACRATNRHPKFRTAEPGTNKLAPNEIGRPFWAAYLACSTT